VRSERSQAEADREAAEIAAAEKWRRQRQDERAPGQGCGLLMTGIFLSFIALAMLGESRFRKGWAWEWQTLFVGLCLLGIGLALFRRSRLLAALMLVTVFLFVWVAAEPPDCWRWTCFYK
jgi:hypothetical protein